MRSRLRGAHNIILLCCTNTIISTRRELSRETQAVYRKYRHFPAHLRREEKSFLCFRFIEWAITLIVFQKTQHDIDVILFSNYGSLYRRGNWHRFPLDDRLPWHQRWKQPPTRLPEAGKFWPGQATFWTCLPGRAGNFLSENTNFKPFKNRLWKISLAPTALADVWWCFYRI